MELRSKSGKRKVKQDLKEPMIRYTDDTLMENLI